MNRFLSCDWGTSTFRLRLVDAHTKKIVSEVISDEGIAETHRQWVEACRPEWERIDYYKSKLTESIGQLSVKPDRNIPLILSGMGSSSIGLKELQYSKFPFHWDLKHWVAEKLASDEKFSYPMVLVSGFQTDSDIMRGEETKLLGCEIPDDKERIFIFPGTHSKHVLVKNGTGVDFRTYMTGELFNLLSEKSILQHAVKKGKDEKSFAEGVKAGRDGNILHELFGIRVRQILNNADPVGGYQWLSGLLIGTELNELKDLSVPIYLVSSENLKKAYRVGLEIMGFRQDGIHDLDADEMLINGHNTVATHYF
jgi:2-dehydro-3-deoxygalactonokinase